MTIFQMREQDTSSGEKLMEITNLLDKKFKVMVIKILSKLRRNSQGEQCENFIKEEENIRSTNQMSEEYNN